MIKTIILLFAAIISSEALSELVLHKTALAGENIFTNPLLYIGCGLYVLIGVLYVYILTIYKNLAIPNAIWQALTVISGTALSIFYFGETLSHQQIIGIGLVFAGILVVSQ